MNWDQLGKTADLVGVAEATHFAMIEGRAGSSWSRWRLDAMECSLSSVSSIVHPFPPRSDRIKLEKEYLDLQVWGVMHCAGMQKQWKHSKGLPARMQPPTCQPACLPVRLPACMGNHINQALCPNSH